MASLERTIQTFESEDGTQLTSLPCHDCEETGAQYVLWRDVQKAFEGVSFLKGEIWHKALFEVDSDGQLWQPLRLERMPHRSYVVYSHPQLLQSTRSQHIHQENSGALSINTHNNIEFDGHSQNQMHNYSFSHFETLYRFCEQLDWLITGPCNSRVQFVQFAANTRYYHSMVKEEMERLHQAGLEVKVDGKHRSQILEELRDLEEQVPEWDYRNECWNTLTKATNRVDYVIPPTLYIVLPSDLDSWLDSDLSTHQFRLFFLCDSSKKEGTAEDLPQHMHLANHPGYVIQRPQEFFQMYGDYSSRILQMVKHGYSNAPYEIPPLETFKILWNCDPNIIGSHLTRDTLGPLMDKAISYIQELSLPTRNTDLSLTHKESVAIKTFLVVQEGDNAEGNLCRHITSRHIFWTCQSHLNQRFNQSAMKDLKEFVFGHGGHIDLHQSTLKVELGSEVEARQFLTLLTSTNHIFDISMKLCWKASRSYMRDLCLGIAKTGTTILEIDGISVDIIQQGHLQYATNLFSDELILDTGLQPITLLNYPQPQEQCFHFNDFSLQSTLPSTQLVGSREDLSDDLDKFRRLVYKVQVESDLNIAVAELQAVLEKHGLFDVIAVTFYDGNWNAVIDMEKMAFVEVYSRDAVCPRAVLTSGSLLRLTIDCRDDGNCQQDFIDILQSNTGLKELNISYYGHDVHYYIDHVVKMWHQSSSSLCLTLLDRMEDTQGRVIAQLARSRGDAEFRGISPVDILEVSADPTLRQEQQVSDDLVDIQFMSWNCDHISGQLSDYSASFLDMATEQHPSVLILLTLDISQLSRTGLVSVQNILDRSSLEHLHILCSPFNPTTSESIAQVLGSVQWLTLKSLVLSGDHIDEWIKLWPLSSQAPQLMHLRIHSTESKKQELSHSSVLFLHELVFMSPLQEFDIKNITLKDIHDRGLIRAGEDEL